MWLALDDRMLMQKCFFQSDGRRYSMIGFDAEMMLAILNDIEPFYWGA
jgi:hypothetical protein